MDVTKESWGAQGAQEAEAAARNPRRWVILVVLCLSALVLVIGAPLSAVMGRHGQLVPCGP